MKDKLVKFHHKAPYYRLRKFFLSIVLCASCFMVVSVPAYVSKSAHAKEDINQTTSLVWDKDLIVDEVKVKCF